MTPEAALALERCREKYRYYVASGWPETLRKALGPTEGRRRLISQVREDFARALSARPVRYRSTRDCTVWRRAEKAQPVTPEELARCRERYPHATPRILDALAVIERSREEAHARRGRGATDGNAVEAGAQ